MENLGGTITVIIVIGLSVILMVVFPLMTTADRADEVTQQVLDTEVSNLVNDVCTTGKLTEERYDKFVEKINSTGYAYKVEMTKKTLDENAAKKTLQTSGSKIGENEYYEEYTTQLLDNLTKDRSINFKEGDFFYVYVVNPNPTISTQLKKFFFRASGDDTYTTVASSSGMSTTTAK